MLEAFPFETVPKYLLWDRDADTCYSNKLKLWTLGKDSDRLDQPGNGPTSNESSARFAATVSTT
jgi:hypothetical protein